VRLIPAGSIFLLLALGALWFWCRNGGLTSIRIVANGEHYQAFLDDRLIADYTKESSSEEGGIVFIQGGRMYWGVPLGQRLESVRVTDNDSGKVLLYQDFNLPLEPIWVERGVALPPDPLGCLYGGASISRLGTGYREWLNYTLELNVRTLLELDVLFRYRDGNNYVKMNLRPFREMDGGFTFVTEGKSKFEWTERPYYKTREIVMNIALLFLYSFPPFLIILAVIVLVLALNYMFVSMMRKNYYWYEVLFLIILFLGAFVYLLWINYYILDHIPHVQDSVTYNFQAQLLSRGRLFAPAPPVPLAFSLESFYIFKDGKWFGQYPFGHPFLLMFGQFIDRPWVIPPLVGAFVLIVVYLIAKELFSRKVAAVASLLAFSSPFFQMNASNFMSHSSASLYLALAVLFLIRACNGEAHSRRKLYAFLSGLALGLLFNTRPLNALPAIALSGLALIYFLFARRIGFKGVLCFCLGGLLMLAFYLYANYVLMGDPLASPAGSPVSLFKGDHLLGVALMNYYTLMSLFLMTIFGWPTLYAALFFVSFIILGKKNIWNFYLFLLFLSMSLVNVFYTALNTTAHMYGPRYVYEVFFIFIIMAAHGWDRAIQFTERGLNRIYGCSRRSLIIACATNAVFLSILIVLTYNAQLRWLGKGINLYDFSFTPRNVYGLKGFNSVSGQMADRIRKSNIHNALIFAEGHEWWCYGALLSLSSPFLDSDILVVHDLGEEDNKKVIDAFPGRKLYRVNVRSKELRDY
jgi:hypothetical protein